MSLRRTVLCAPNPPFPLVLAGVDRLMLAVLTSAYTVDEVGGDEADAAQAPHQT